MFVTQSARIVVVVSMLIVVIALPNVCLCLSLICGSKGQWLRLTDSKLQRDHILERNISEQNVRRRDVRIKTICALRICLFEYNFFFSIDT